MGFLAYLTAAQCSPRSDRPPRFYLPASARSSSTSTQTLEQGDVHKRYPVIAVYTALRFRVLSHGHGPSVFTRTEISIFKATSSPAHLAATIQVGGLPGT